MIASSRRRLGLSSRPGHARHPAGFQLVFDRLEDRGRRSQLVGRIMDVELRQHLVHEHPLAYSPLDLGQPTPQGAHRSSRRTNSLVVAMRVKLSATSDNFGDASPGCRYDTRCALSRRLT